MQPDEYQTMARVESSHPWFVNRRRLIRGLVRRFAPRRRPLRILDAGCGTGQNLTDYARMGQVVGVEFDRHAASISSHDGTHCVVVGDVCRIPLRDSSFDLVISTDVIEHIQDDTGALREMARVLAPAGRILLTTPAYSRAYSAHDRYLRHVRRYDRPQLLAAFRRAGLRLLHIARYNVLLAAPVVLHRLWQQRRTRDAGNGSDVARPIPRLVRPALDALWHLEAALAERIDLGVGLTHLAVLARD